VFSVLSIVSVVENSTLLIVLTSPAHVDRLAAAECAAQQHDQRIVRAGLFEQIDGLEVEVVILVRVVLFLEEIVQLAGISYGARESISSGARESISSPEAAPHVESRETPVREPSDAEAVLRQTDDLKVIVETVEREVIDRAMRRVEGNQSRGAHVLNISRGSLIAKLKEYGIPDYRYLRRERTRRF